MIFIMLGTIQLQFTRPLVEVEKLCKKGVIKDKVIIQSGHTEYTSPYFEIKPFFSGSDLDKLINEASLIISHAGTGSIVSAIKKNKKVIAIARCAELNEHVDNHQYDLLREFAHKNYIIAWYEINNLEKIILDSQSFIPQPYVSYKNNIIKYLDEIIDSTV